MVFKPKHLFSRQCIRRVRSLLFALMAKLFDRPCSTNFDWQNSRSLTVECLPSLAVMFFQMPVEGYQLVFSNSHVPTLIYLWYALQHKINCNILSRFSLAVVFQFRDGFSFTFAIHSTMFVLISCCFLFNCLTV